MRPRGIVGRCTLDNRFVGDLGHFPRFPVRDRTVLLMLLLAIAPARKASGRNAK
jgi:hypothetical protein